MAVFQGSRYVKTPAYRRNGESLILSIRERTRFRESDCRYYTVVQGDTLDGISYKMYSNSQLGWAILDANPLYMSEMDIKSGDIILIPPFEEVAKVCE